MPLATAKKRNLTRYDVLIIASMVEREAQLDSERPLVAAVIHNRLREGMPLGIDATIRYVENNWTSPLKVSELERPGPYNTRLNRGLPPTPIGNPGLAEPEGRREPLAQGLPLLRRQAGDLRRARVLEHRRAVLARPRPLRRRARRRRGQVADQVLTRLGVCGWPVGHSRSPAMHNAALRELGLDDWRYQHLPLPPELFAEAVRALARAGFRGVNVTIPHKEAALALADEATATARAVGAANTLTFQDSGIAADNTDVTGLLRAIPSRHDPRGRRARSSSGAGGAARAAVHALRHAPARRTCKFSTGPTSGPRRWPPSWAAARSAAPSRRTSSCNARRSS